MKTDRYRFTLLSATNFMRDVFSSTKTKTLITFANGIVKHTQNDKIKIYTKNLYIKNTLLNKTNIKLLHSLITSGIHKNKPSSIARLQRKKIKIKPKV